ncbi:MAG TPA: hypothetical protein VGO96_07685 [Pyrinomonadaceae bacterium]|jgi:hypothetical protein|nr:hypothetical protein [Pyrinomonadaceae bacterium]
MFCPTCGAGEQRADAYCTRCGQWLTDANAAQGHWHPVFRRARTPEQRMRMMLVFNAMDAALALAAAILLFSTQAGRSEAQAHVFIAAAFCIVIAVHQVVSLIINLKIQRRLKRAREEKAAEAIAEGANAGSAHALDAGDSGLFVNVQGSVTENTTELLQAVPRQTEQRQTR